VADLVNMTMTVHQDRAAGDGLQTTNEPIAVDKCRTYAFGKRFGRPWIFDHVVVQRNNSAGVWIFSPRDMYSPHLLGGDHA
jgi:hypothetical protein